MSPCAACYLQNFRQPAVDRLVLSVSLEGVGGMSSNGNGRSGGKKCGGKIVRDFTMGELEAQAKRRGFQLVLKDPATPAYCGFLECGHDFRRKQRVQLVKDLGSGRICLWCAYRHQWPAIRAIYVRWDDLLFTIAKVAGFKLVPLGQISDELPIRQDSEPNGRKKRRIRLRRRSSHRPAYSQFRH